MPSARSWPGSTEPRLTENALVKNPELRARRRADLDSRLARPAAAYLEKSRGGTEHPEYVEASLTFFAGDAETALEQLARLGERAPSFYDADLLAAEIHSEIFRA